MNSTDVLKAIRKIAQYKKIKISDLEKNTNKSIGYISRSIKDKSKVSIDFINECAKVLGYEKLSTFMAELEEIVSAKICPLCNGIMKFENNIYICENCKAELRESDKEWVYLELLELKI